MPNTLRTSISLRDKLFFEIVWPRLKFCVAMPINIIIWSADNEFLRLFCKVAVGIIWDFELSDSGNPV